MSQLGTESSATSKEPHRRGVVSREKNQNRVHLLPFQGGLLHDFLVMNYEPSAGIQIKTRVREHLPELMGLQPRFLSVSWSPMIPSFCSFSCPFLVPYTEVEGRVSWFGTPFQSLLFPGEERPSHTSLALSTASVMPMPLSQFMSPRSHATSGNGSGASGSGFARSCCLHLSSPERGVQEQLLDTPVPRPDPLPSCPSCPPHVGPAATQCLRGCTTLHGAPVASGCTEEVLCYVGTVSNGIFKMCVWGALYDEKLLKISLFCNWVTHI